METDYGNEYLTKSDTYKMCNKCGNIFKTNLNYKGYDLPKNKLVHADPSYKFHGNDFRFVYVDLCDTCANELSDMLRRWLDG